MRKRTKVQIVVFFFLKKRPKREKRERTYNRVRFDISRERESHFSLDFREIRTSEFVGTRRKAVLRGEAYAWAPVLGSFDKLREVGVSSYLSFTLCLSVFMMFELIEAMSGRLIGPKAWNRIVRKF